MKIFFKFYVSINFVLYCVQSFDIFTVIIIFIVLDDFKLDDDDDDDDIIFLSIDNFMEEFFLKILLFVIEFIGSGERQINFERDNYNVDKIISCWKCSEKFVFRKLLVRYLKEYNIVIFILIVLFFKVSIIIIMESDIKDNSVDIFYNLLGVDVGFIDQMLDFVDSVVKLLGM